MSARKLTGEQAAAIFMDTRPKDTIAAEYSISGRLVTAIRNRRVWTRATSGLIRPIRSDDSYGGSTPDFKAWGQLPAFERLMLAAEPHEPCRAVVGTPGLTIPRGKRFALGAGSGSWVRLCARDRDGRIRVKPDCESAPRIVWEHFNGPVPEGLQVNHHCDQPPCFRIDHIYAGTAQDNMDDMRRRGRGRWLNGEDVPGSKLTDEQVRAIYLDERPTRVIAAEYDVHGVTVNGIRRRATRRDATAGLPPRAGR